MIEYMMEYARDKGIKSIHYLVSKHNLMAQKAYARLEFNQVGECQLYEDDYFCYEKKSTFCVYRCCCNVDRMF